MTLLDIKGRKGPYTEKVLCPSIKEFQDREAGVHRLVSRGRGNRIGGLEGKLGKGIMIEM